MQSNMNSDSSEKKNPSKPAAGLRINPGAAWKGRVTLLGLGLVLILPLSFTALDFLGPKSPCPGQGSFTRTRWYLRSGQWHADVHTLVCALEFVMQDDATTATAAASPAKQLTAAPRPASLDSPALSQVKPDELRLPNS
jgi:hypothetical protein